MNWKLTGKAAAALVAVLLIGWMVFRMGALASSDAQQVTKSDLRSSLAVAKEKLDTERRARVALQVQVRALGVTPVVGAPIPARLVPVPGRPGRDGTDGKDGAAGKAGADSTVPGPPGASVKGDPGQDGRGVKHTECTPDGWVVTYTDGTTESAGPCTTPASPTPVQETP